MKSDDSINNMY